jgi:hypothetical protein
MHVGICLYKVVHHAHSSPRSLRSHFGWVADRYPGSNPTSHIQQESTLWHLHRTKTSSNDMYHTFVLKSGMIYLICPGQYIVHQKATRRGTIDNTGQETFAQEG